MHVLKNLCIGWAVWIFSSLLAMGSLTDGLVSWYPFDGNASDLSGNGNHAQPANSYSFVSGQVDRGIRTVGSSSVVGGHVMLPYKSELQSSNFSFSVWVKEEQMLYSHGEAYFVFGQLALLSRYQGSSIFPFTSITDYQNGLVVSNWNLYSIVKQDSLIKGYLNDSLVAQANWTVPSTFSPTHSALGRHWWGGGSDSSTRLVAVFDELRIYQRALSLQEVQALHTWQGANNPPTNLNVISDLAVAENEPIGTIVGEFNATDPDANTTLSYHLVNGEGDGNNSLFSLDTNGTIKTSTIFDFESNASTYSIRVQVRDEQNATTEGNFTVSILDQPDLLYNNTSVATALATAMSIDTTNFTLLSQGSSDLTIGTALEINGSMDLTFLTQGDFYLNQPLSFNGEQTVKIKANGNVYLNAPITASSANGKLIIQYGLGQNTTSNNKRIYIRSPIHLQSGNNLSKKRGSDGIEETYIVITQLGTFTDTTTIPSPMTLQGMHTGLTSSYALGADIEANSTISWNNGNGFFPIGSPNGQFRGKFDGLGHSIKGLSINRQTTDNVGFFANTFKSKISNLALQDISISGKNSVGGLAGGDYQSYTQGINDFSNISITGQIVGEMNVGGFLGFARYSSVSNSYSLASVQSTQTTGKVGGFFGHNHEYSKIINSYSAGLISGGDSRGGLIGGALFGPTNLITNSFWDTQVSEQSNSFGGLGKSTEAMKSLNTYSNAGWNSSPNTGTWKVSDGKYPVLPWQNPLNSSPLQLQPINVLSFSENLPIMSLIGEFNATDPDTNASLSFSLVDGNGSSSNPLFFLETNGSLSTLALFDFETNSTSYSIRVRVQDEHNASIEGNFSIALTNQVEDFDQDGTEDYFDLDDDNDGFADTIELAYGSDPRNSNSVANAPPHSISLNNSNILENQPSGALVGLLSATDPDANSSLLFSLVDGNGSSSNSLFWLDTNGSLSTQTLFDFETNSSSYSIRVRVQDEYNASIEGNFSILLTNQVEDFDQDGTEDYFDLDDDNDGFPDTIELAYGSDPRDSNSVANAPPHSISLNNSNILENQPSGALVGSLSATDPDTNSSLLFSLVDGNGSSSNSLFWLDTNGSLSTQTLFDFETNSSSYSIRVRVQDEHNASIEGNFSIALTNQVEDFDQDGTEDYFDLDDDNDGFPDTIELAYGSDPRDSNSVANAPPYSISLNNSNILENQPSGSLVGSVSATDPDANSSLLFSLVDGNGSSGNAFFLLETNGSLSTQTLFDFETNSSSYSIRVRVQDEHNASIEGNFSITLTNQVENFDQDGTEDYFDLDDDNDGFPDTIELAYGSDPRDSNSVANATPHSISLNNSNILENQPSGARVGLLSATDPDAYASLSFSLVDGNGSSGNAFFLLETNGSLSTQTLFDFETNSSSYSIRVRVQDEYNASIEGNFSILLTNQVEDFDQDGTEDYFDLDDDNDGFADTIELAYGSDPRNSNSVANAPPHSISLNNSNILENQPSGSLVGSVSATDPDANSSLLFSLIDGNGSSDNAYFLLDTNGSVRTQTVFDFEKNQSLFSIRVQASDEHNATLDDIFLISLVDSTPPLVQSLDAITTKDKEILLRATISNNLTLPTLEAGFQVSDNSLFSEFTFWQTTEFNNSAFSTSLSIADFKEESEYFYRAYAKNAEGISLANAKSFSIPKSQTLSTHWWENSPETTGGWRESTWFGIFLPHNNGWIYHDDLKWLFAHPGDTGDLWLWSSEFGWLWTAPGVYPHLFNYSTANWLYFIKQKDGREYFYDYAIESVK